MTEPGAAPPPGRPRRRAGQHLGPARGPAGPAPRRRRRGTASCCRHGYPRTPPRWAASSELRGGAGPAAGGLPRGRTGRPRPRCSTSCWRTAGRCRGWCRPGPGGGWPPAPAEPGARRLAAVAADRAGRLRRRARLRPARHLRRRRPATAPSWTAAGPAPGATAAPTAPTGSPPPPTAPAAARRQQLTGADDGRSSGRGHDLVGLGEPAVAAGRAASALAPVPGPQHLLQARAHVRGLARVRPQRRQLAVEGVGDVDAVVGLGRPIIHTSGTAQASRPSSASSSGCANGLRASG